MYDPNKDPPPPSYDGYGGYPPQAAPYPPQQGAYPLQQGAYPLQQGTYPLQQGAYSPQQAAYPLQQGAYPLQQVVYPPQCPTPGPAYPTEGAYPPNQKVYGDVDVGYCTNDTEILIPVENGGLSDTKIRHGFIRKVYLIQFFQFGIAVASIFLMQHFVGNLRDELIDSDFHDLSKYEDMSNKVDIASWSCFAIASGLGILFLFSKIRRKHPINIILLILFTLTMSGFVGCVTVSFESQFSQFITIAVICTCIIILSLTLFACQTTIDFTMSQGPYNLAIFMIFLYSGFLLLFKYHWHYFHLELFGIIVGGFLVSILSVVMVYETQRLTGEQFEDHLSPEEYVFGVLTINIGVIALLSRGIFLCLRVFRIYRVIH